MRLADKTACLSCVKNYSEVIVILQENYRQKLENSPISINVLGDSTDEDTLPPVSMFLESVTIFLTRNCIIIHALYFSETFQSFFFISKNLQVPMQLRSLFLLTEMTRYALHRIEFILSFMCLCNILKCRKSCLEKFFRSFPLKWQVHATTSVKFC